METIEVDKKELKLLLTGLEDPIVEDGHGYDYCKFCYEREMYNGKGGYDLDHDLDCPVLVAKSMSEGL